MTGLPSMALPSCDSLLPPLRPPLLAQSFLLLHFTSQPRSFSPSCKSSLPSLDLAQASPLGAFTAARASPAVPLITHSVTTKLWFLGSNGPFTASSEGFVVAVSSTPRGTPGSPNGRVNERMNERRLTFMAVLGWEFVYVVFFMLHSLTWANSVKPVLQASASSPARLGEVQRHS